MIVKTLRWTQLLRTVGAVFVIAAASANYAMAQDRALVIAIDSYADARLSGLPASLAKNDSQSIEKLLTTKLGYKKEDVKVLRNEQATKKAILSAIETWINQIDPKAAKLGAGQPQLIGLEESGALNKPVSKKRKKKRVRKKYVPPPKVYRSFIYFSGLGYFRPDSGTEEKDGVDEGLVPYDAKVTPANGADAIQGMILDDDLAAALKKMTRRHVTLVLDTSTSGFFTRSTNLASKTIARSRTPPLVGAVRNLSQSGMDLHKQEGAFVDVDIPRGSLTVWSAVSPTQTALVAGPDDAPMGLFTLLFVEGVSEGKADANDNGIISNAELLRHVSKGSATYCAAFKKRCEMGLRPRLDPPQAFGRTAWVDRKRVTHARQRHLSVSRVMDFLGTTRESNIEIKQFPPSPVAQGTEDIHYQITSPTSAFLVLLNLTQDGRIFQLYPNQFAGKDEDGYGGLLAADTPLRVPATDSGLKLTATEEGKGHIIAVVTPDPVKFDEAVADRVIASVSPNEAMSVYLARLAAGLHHPMNTESLQTNTSMSRWSAVAMPYEIVSKKMKPTAAKVSN